MAEFGKKNIKLILETLKAAPLKKFGQNFLINESVAKKLSSFAEEKTIIEIGGGMGQISLHLSNKAEKLLIIEKDKALAKFLKNYFQKNKNVSIIEDDALDVLKHTNKIAKKYIIENGKFQIIGNFPYNIASKIIELSLLAEPTPKNIIAMAQKEVAQRIAAEPPKMNYLAAKMQYLADPKILFYIKKGSFWPIPKVDSAAIKITPKKNIKDLRENYKKFISGAKVLFSHPRKTIRRNLKLNNKKLVLPENILNKRAEQLELEEIIKISNEIQK